MMTLYGCPKTRSTRALWALEEASASYHYVHVDLHSGAGRKPPYSEINPAGKVPALVDGDFVLSESAAICAYIGARHPDSLLVPTADPRARAVYDQWCCFVLSELEQPLWTMAKHSFALPERLRVAGVMATARWEFRKAAKIVGQHLESRKFVAADHFTAADILLAHTLAWARGSAVPLEQRALEAYADRTLARPALARARQREQPTTRDD